MRMVMMLIAIIPLVALLNVMFSFSIACLYLYAYMICFSSPSEFKILMIDYDSPIEHVH